MSAGAPITQDVLTIPRKLPDAADGRVNLVGLTRDGAARRADRRRHAREAGEDAGRSDLAVDLPLGRARFRRDDEPCQGLPRASRRTLRDRGARGRDAPGVGRRHAQVPRPHRRRARGRDRLHPRGRPRHALHLVPGRLHADLLVLPHRHPEAGAQPHGGRDRRPDHAGARRSGRMAAAGRRHGRGRPAASVEHRADGHGRAALQFRRRARRHEDRDGRRGHRPLAPPDHAVDLRRGARDRPDRRGDRLHAGVSASTPRPTRSATSLCRSTRSGTSRRFSTRLRAYPEAVELRADHLRVRHAEGRERQRRGCAAAGAG